MNKFDFERYNLFPYWNISVVYDQIKLKKIREENGIHEFWVIRDIELFKITDQTRALILTNSKKEVELYKKKATIEEAKTLIKKLEFINKIKG